MPVAQLCICLAISVFGSGNQMHIAVASCDFDRRLFCSVSQRVHRFGSGTLVSKLTNLMNPSTAFYGELKERCTISLLLHCDYTVVAFDKSYHSTCHSLAFAV